MSVIISGIGVTSSIGQGRETFTNNLLAGRQAFGLLDLPGQSYKQSGLQFVGAQIDEFALPLDIKNSGLNNVSRSGQIALATLAEAWEDAGLSAEDPERIGLMVAGSNFLQRDLYLAHERYGHKPFFIDPSHALKFMDTDFVGLCSSHFDIKGMGCTVGGASASGQLALIQAMQNLLSGMLDTVIVLAPVMDLSFLELQALRSIGAMGTSKYFENPERASRPFDSNRDGFIFGESCAAVVMRKIETSDTDKPAYAEVKGVGVAMDRNRNPNSSVSGEVSAINSALNNAALSASGIDYVNPHGTGSKSGDEVELKALELSGLKHAAINTSKSILGHGLCAAGLVELVATIVQIKEGTLHPSLNLEEPIDEGFAWVVNQGTEKSIEHALTLSYGFGGINTAICLQAVS